MNVQLETSKKSTSQNEFFTVPTTDVDVFDAQEAKCNETTCGIGTWKPKWLQCFATQNFYIVNYCILSILEGAYFVYLIGIISTLEKRFTFNSGISGLILIANNIGPMIITPLIAYYGIRNHRPKWIAGSAIVTAISCLLSIFPHFIYGIGTPWSNSGNFSIYGLNDHGFCKENLQRTENCDKTKEFSSESAVIIFFLASLLEGIGSTALYAFGIPYLNDNVKKKDSSLNFGSIYLLKLSGPSVGFILASICLSYYEQPSHDPGFDDNDSRWIGAWWMGFLILASLLLIFSFPMILFPSRLVGGKVIMQNQVISSSITKVKEMYQYSKRLLKNPLLVCHAISVTFRLMGSFGYYIFMPKYIENQFGQSAATANFFTGSTAILSMLVSILSGWYLIHKFNSKPRKLTAYIVIMETFTFFGILSLMIFGCHKTNMYGTSENSPNLLLNNCNKACGCDKAIFNPICGPDGVTTYFSSCFAGCSEINNTIDSLVYTNCKCLYDDKQLIAPSDATEGFCPLNCNTFLPYLIVLILSTIISSTAQFGNSLITSKCVEPRDKNISLVPVGVVLVALVSIPYLIIFGSLTDSTCLIWNEKCDKIGNCWLYDSDKFRYSLHGLSASLILIGVVFEFAVYCMSTYGKEFFHSKDDLPPVDLSKLPIEGEEEDIIYSKIPEYQKSSEWR